ncbi:GerMN domain-containing protein [Bacillus dakarensis]|uniref:GerMN domain-containing protein n=1 Tax=Robertmurraya dakarensis TaxID=1926278 RepID=UPI000A073B1D|nr:hypothetical protein [Bacillus dakarensis]
MVKKSELSDKQLEEYLRELPKIRDHRDPRDIYQNITVKMKKRKQKAWIIPSIASAAALLLFVVLASNVLNFNQSAQDLVNENATTESAENAALKQAPDGNEEMGILSEDEPDNKERFNAEEENRELMTIDLEGSYTALYESDIAGKSVFTYTIPDQNAQNIVPVSVTVPYNDELPLFEQYKETMSKLREEEWNLSEYLPLNASLSYVEESNSLHVDLPIDHYYGDGSASEMAFMSTLLSSAAMFNIESILLSTDGSPGAEFGNMGKLTEIEVEEKGNRAYYFFYPSGEDNLPYLVPSRNPYENINEAMDAMKTDIETDMLKASIPSNFNIEDMVTANKELLVIRLGESSELSNDQSMIHTIEAILLTAKDFDYEKVKIENANLDQIGKFIFNEEWAVPVAPNKKFLSE